jgi:DNA adenine methylase
MVAKLLKLIPPHKVYVEVFGGGASLLLTKEPSPVEVYNDIDGDLVNLFRVLRDEEKFQRFYRLVCLTPYSREEYNFCRQTLEDCQDDVERAYRFFVLARQSFGGRVFAGWGFSVTENARGMAGACSSWLNAIEKLPEFHARIMRVQIEHNDFRKIIPAYDTPETFFYCDPPYVPDVRRLKQAYRYEMTLDDHKDLVDLLLRVRGKAMLSGYRHEVYEPLEKAGWKRIDFPTACHVVGRTRYTKILGEGSALRMQPRVESVWLNYEPPVTFLRRGSY